jgi:hypothetical protein
LSLSILRTLGAIDVSVTESRTELDLHADQCAIGSNLLVIHDFDRPTNVTGYNQNGPVNSNLCTVSTALAYDDALTGESVILVVHQSYLYSGPQSQFAIDNAAKGE